MDVGVIGIGVMGRNHVRTYSEMRGIGDIYVYDTIEENAIGVKDIATISKSMDDIRRHVDAVSICVPTPQHFETTTKIIDAGIDCLIEKPITLSVEEGLKLLNKIENNDVIVGVGHIERFNPMVEEIQKITQRPAYVSIKRHNPGSDRITDTSVVEDLMIHDIDVVFNTIFKDARQYEITSMGNRNVCEALIRFDESVVSISASRLSSKKFRTFYAETPDYTVDGDYMTQEVYIHRRPDKYEIKDEQYTQENVIEKVGINKKEPLKTELTEFVRCVRNRRQFPVTPYEAIKNLRICDEIKRGMM